IGFVAFSSGRTHVSAPGATHRSAGTREPKPRLTIEPVADAAYADQELRLRRHSFDLLPQVENVGVDDAIANVGARPPRVLDQLLAREDTTPAANQRPQQPE